MEKEIIFKKYCDFLEGMLEEMSQAVTDIREKKDRLTYYLRAEQIGKLSSGMEFVYEFCEALMNDSSKEAYDLYIEIGDRSAMIFDELNLLKEELGLK